MSDGLSEIALESKPRYRAAVDTPLGVTFHDFYALGKGPYIVAETVERKIAEVMGFKPSEVELVTVTDNETGKLLWPKDA